MRVIFDTNVFVSAAIAQGAPHRVLDSWFGRRSFDLVVCPELLAELTGVLGRPKLRKWINQDDARVLVNRLASVAEMVDDPAQVLDTTRDPGDDYLVALALEHDVDAIVSGDKDLLEWQGSEPRILSPAQFEDLLRAD